MLDSAKFSLGRRLPSTASAEGSPLCSAASSVLRSDPTPPARTCPQYGIKPFQTGLSVRQARWRSPGSRACCFSACAGSQTTQGRLAARDSATSRVAFPARETVGVPGPILFRSSIARPTDALVYASTHTSRCQSQDSGSRWSRSLLSCGALSSPSRVEDWRGPLRRPSPIPATSNPACGFPALGLLACFASRVMWPIRSGALSRMIPIGTLGMH